MKIRLGIVLMIFSSIFVCFGQLFWKLSNSTNITLIGLGFFFYVIGALFMIIAYRFGPLSLLQPILSLNYVISILLAMLILKENINIFKCIAVCIIIIGVLCITKGERK